MDETPPHPPHAPSRGRWFQFSLRTLFVVVTVLCCWLGYSLNWIRQRHEVISTKSQNHRYYLPYDKVSPSVILVTENDDLTAPGLLWIFGEKAWAVVVLMADTPPDEVKRIESLFPEADVRPIMHADGSFEMKGFF